MSGPGRVGFFLLAVVLLGLAVALPVAPGPAPEEATYLSMIDSLWHDHDLLFERVDLGRALERWPEGPRGVALLSPDAGATSYFARPLAYPLVVMPFYALLGGRGLLIFNALLWLAFAAALLTRRRFEDPPSTVWWLGFVVGTAALAYLFRAQAETFVATALFAALWLWRRGRHQRPEAAVRGGIGLVVAGLAIGLAAVHEPLAWVFAVAILVDLLAARRLNALVGFLSAALVVTLVLSSLQHRWVGAVVGPTTLQARFVHEFPLSSLENQRRAVWERALKGAVPPSPTSITSSTELNPRPATLAARSGGFELTGLGGAANAPRNFLYLLLGRHLGLLAYFPFVLAALLLAFFGRGDRQQKLLLAAVVVGLAVIVWSGPPRDSVALEALGDGRLALLASALWLVAGKRTGASGALPWLAAALWTLPAVMAAMPVSTPLTEATVTLSSSPLPLEVTLAAAGRLPGYATRLWGDQTLWLVPRETFYVDEGHPHGVWLRGDSVSEVFVVSRQPRLDLAVDVHALSDGSIRLRTSAGSVGVEFDSLAKRQGSRLHLVAKPMAQLPSPFTAQSDERVYYYRVQVTVEGGKIALMHDPTSSDRRFLGAFLDFTGEGL